jgi:hypothetical protein
MRLKSFAIYHYISIPPTDMRGSTVAVWVCVCVCECVCVCVCVCVRVPNWEKITVKALTS